MRIMLVAALLASTMLAGCSGGGLSDHVIQRGDLGDGFSYWKVNADAREEGIDRNPGPFDAADFRDAGVRGAYLAAFSYNNSENPVIVSQALRFNNETAATAFFTGFGGCSPDAFVIQKGATLSLVQFIAFFAEDEDEELLWQEAHDAAHAIEARVGGESLCEDESH